MINGTHFNRNKQKNAIYYYNALQLQDMAHNKNEPEFHAYLLFIQKTLTRRRFETVQIVKNLLRLGYTYSVREIRTYRE